jgi:hypothetical protein
LRDFVQAGVFIEPIQRQLIEFDVGGGGLGLFRNFVENLILAVPLRQFRWDGV